ncbi:hypothetical protein [Comamonas terrigena]|uniref:hypothetical protein n=1 Tax=Comamonas terrigena TaxID=32013 RepID=UPI0011543D12|nr:hypothetical protein [Comamonas terrigena]MBD9531258.1 hypothetical protein [Comamonas sp. CMM01]
MGTYFLTRQRTVFCYAQSGERLLGLAEAGLPKDVTVQHQGANIPRLTRTLIAFWNNGEKSIVGDDIVATDRLRVRFPDGSQVLAATVVKQTRDVCQVEASQTLGKPAEVALSFAFLDADDGAIVEILHTSEKSHGKIFGTIKGLPKGLREVATVGDRSSSSAKTMLTALMSPRKFALIVVVAGFLAFAWGAYALHSDLGSSGWAQFATVGGLFYMTIGFLMLFLMRQKHPKALHMKEFD